MSVQNIAAKFRRAMRHGTGASFSNEQMHELASHGVLDLIVRAEADELCRAIPRRSLSATSGLTADVMEDPLAFGKSRLTPKNRAPISIGVLSAGF